MKLLLKSLKTEGTLRFRDAIPFNLEMLATITNCNIDTVNTAINTFISLGLMEKWEDGTLYMLEVQNMVGSETSWAEKKREYRNKIRTMSSKRPDTLKTKIRHVRLEIEIDIDKDKDKDDEEAEKYEELNEMLLNAQVAKDKKNKQLENLSQANLQNQILD